MRSSFISSHIIVLCHAKPCRAIPHHAVPCRALLRLACHRPTILPMFFMFPNNKGFTPTQVEKGEVSLAELGLPRCSPEFLLEPDTVREPLCSPYLPRVQYFLSLAATPSMMASSDCWSSLRASLTRVSSSPLMISKDSLGYKKKKGRSYLPPGQHHED